MCLKTYNRKKGTANSCTHLTDEKINRWHHKWFHSKWRSTFQAYSVSGKPHQTGSFEITCIPLTILDQYLKSHARPLNFVKSSRCWRRWFTAQISTYRALWFTDKTNLFDFLVLYISTRVWSKYPFSMFFTCILSDFEATMMKNVAKRVFYGDQWIVLVLRWRHYVGDITLETLTLTL